MKPMLISFVVAALANVLLLFGLITVNYPAAVWVLLAGGATYWLCMWQAKKKKASEAAMFLSAAFYGIFFGLGYNGWFYVAGFMAGVFAFFGLVKIWLNSQDINYFFAWFVASSFVFFVCLVSMRFLLPEQVVLTGFVFFVAHLVLWWVEVKREERREKEVVG